MVVATYLYYEKVCRALQLYQTSLSQIAFFFQIFRICFFPETLLITTNDSGIRVATTATDLVNWMAKNIYK